MTTAEAQVEKRPATEPESVDHGPVFAPATDIYEKADAVLVRCDMPGVDEQNLEITLEDNVLTVKGRQADGVPEGYEPLANEYYTGVYERSFKVSHEIDGSKIKASLKNGVLELALPKIPASAPQRINITTD